MLPFTLSQLTEANFLQVCREQWSETQTLEFKAVLPNNDDAARDEFRKDVCALANAEGGDLIYGISEKGGRADAIVPIRGETPDGVKRRLRQILESRVEPRIHGIQFHHCQLAEGGFVLILRIPSSYDGPHRYGPITEHRFVIRSDTSTSDMTYDQLRTAFGRGATLLEKAAQFRANRMNNKIVYGLGPRKIGTGVILAIHIIPMCGLAGRSDVDIPGLNTDFSILKLDDDYSWHRTTNLDGLVMYPYDDDNGVDCCSQIFRNGIFEILKIVSAETQQNAVPLAVVGPWVGAQLRAGLKTYAAAAPRLGVQGPTVISLSLTNTGGTVLATSGRALTRKPILNDRLDLPETMIEDIAGAFNVDELIRPILDVLYQCYGVSRCNLFDAGGNWCPQ